VKCYIAPGPLVSPQNRPHVEGAPVRWKYERSEIATPSDSSANNQQSHFRRYNNSY